MRSPAAAFKVAQEAALRASAGLAAAMGGPMRIYTEVPTDTPLPYVVIGDDQVLPEETDCGLEAEITATVNLWARRSPLDKGAQARAMGGVIVGVLAASLDLDGWTVDEWGVESERYVTDPDQSTHGVLTFRYLVTEA